MTESSLRTANERLRDALEAIYREFEAPAPFVIEGCPCCIGSRNVDVLLTTPLRELSGKTLWRYVSGAFLTVGSARDFRYLLPRILEVSTIDTEAVPDSAIVLGKLRLANWQSWSSSERQAIEAFIDAWFERELLQDLADAAEEDAWVGDHLNGAESVICGAARADLPLSRWLVRLTDPIAAPVLENLMGRFPGGLSGFWEDAPEGFKELSAILA